MASYNITQNGADGFDVLRDEFALFFGRKNECVDYVLQNAQDTDTVRADDWCAGYTDISISKLRAERIAIATGCGLTVTEKGLIA